MKKIYTFFPKLVRGVVSVTIQGATIYISSVKIENVGMNKRMVGW